MLFNPYEKELLNSKIYKHIPKTGEHLHWFVIKYTFDGEKETFEGAILPYTIWYNKDIKEYLCCPNHRFSPEAESSYVKDFIEKGPNYTESYLSNHYIRIMCAESEDKVFATSQKDALKFFKSLKRFYLRCIKRETQIKINSLQKAIDYLKVTQPIDNNPYIGFKFYREESRKLDKIPYPKILNSCNQ